MKRNIDIEVVSNGWVITIRSSLTGRLVTVVFLDWGEAEAFIRAAALERAGDQELKDWKP